ncbi:hypothetical protein, partial [Escherichia coli]|uniref:hypothetical protein n=1 Tax=Escherichia coli TaxID=562 RepID=UPI001FCD611D
MRSTVTGCVTLTGFPAVVLPLAVIVTFPAGQALPSTAGNPVSVTHPVTVDLTAVAVSINAITSDHVTTAAEKVAALTLSVSTSGVDTRQTATDTFGGQTYHARHAETRSSSPTGTTS